MEAATGVSYAQPIHTGLQYGRRILVSRDGTRLTVIGRFGVVTVQLDVATIERLGCELADTVPCPRIAPELLTVLREA